MGIGPSTGHHAVWRFPLDGSAPKPITAFTSEHIFSYAWSKDGKTLAGSRGTVSADVVLISAGDPPSSN